MTFDNREMFVCLAAICVSALVTAGGTEVAAAYSPFPGSGDVRGRTATTLPRPAVLATFDRASRRSADDLPATLNRCPWDTWGRGLQPSDVVASVPPPPATEQGIECPIDYQ
jgi:hypothetical protein